MCELYHIEDEDKQLKRKTIVHVCTCVCVCVCVFMGYLPVYQGRALSVQGLCHVQYGHLVALLR